MLPLEGGGGHVEDKKKETSVPLVQSCCTSKALADRVCQGTQGLNTARVLMLLVQAQKHSKCARVYICCCGSFVCQHTATPALQCVQQQYTSLFIHSFIHPSTHPSIHPFIHAPSFFPGGQVCTVMSSSLCEVCPYA